MIILTLTLHYSNSLCCNIYKNFRTTVKIDLDCQQNEIIIKHWKKIQLACVYLKLDIKLCRPLLAFLK